MENIVFDNGQQFFKILHWVKIKKGMGDSEVLYKRVDIPNHIWMKWYWYFRYRAALFQVQFPRHGIQMESGSAQVEVQTTLAKEYLTVRIDNARKKKAKIQQYLKCHKPKQLDNLFEKVHDKDHLAMYRSYEDTIINLFQLERRMNTLITKGWSMKNELILDTK